MSDEISFYSKCDKPDETKTIKISEVLQTIKSDKYKTHIEKLMGITGKKERSEYKAKNLPAVTFQGTFSYRSKDKLIEASGLLCLDIDDYTKGKEIKEKIITDPSVFACFISPSGGVKVLVRIPIVKDDDEYKVAYNQVVKHFEHYSPGYDDATKDITRLCFLSYDPDLYHNEQASIIDIDFSKKEEKVTIGVGDTNPLTEKQIERIDKKLIDTSLKDGRLAKFIRGESDFPDRSRFDGAFLQKLLNYKFKKKEIYYVMDKYGSDKWKRKDGVYQNYMYDNAVKWMAKNAFDAIKLHGAKIDELAKKDTNLAATFNKLTQDTDYVERAEEFYQTQPFFYDKSNIWWMWNHNIKCWVIIDDIDLIISLNRHIRDPALTNQNIKARVITAMKMVGRNHIPDTVDNKYIQFVDKLVDIETEEVIDSTPEYFVTNPIPWEIGESDETPTIDRIFKEWVGEKYVPTLYEALAYSLLSSYPIHRIFCFTGSGSNGKSKWLAIISKFIGESNCTTSELDMLLANRFESVKLYRKLVCMMGETNFNEIKRTNLLKSLSGEDPISFEFKNKSGFTGRNYAKIIITTNSLPTTLDKTRGFYRRWLLVDFPNEFPETIDIVSTIPDIEFNNLARKSINILKELLKKREFTNEGDIDERMRRYEETSNPLSSFIKEECITDINEEAPFFEFYEQFTSYLESRGKRKQSKIEVGKSLAREGYDRIKKMHKKPDGSSTTWIYVTGLKLKNSIKQEQDGIEQPVTDSTLDNFSKSVNE